MTYLRIRNIWTKETEDWGYFVRQFQKRTFYHWKYKKKWITNYDDEKLKIEIIKPIIYVNIIIVVKQIKKWSIGEYLRIKTKKKTIFEAFCNAISCRKWNLDKNYKYIYFVINVWK